VLATALGVAAAACSSSGATDATANQVARTRAEQARQVATQAGLPADVADFLALAASAGAATFTADYELGAAGRSHVAQRPPNRAVQVTTADGAMSRFVASAAGSFSCRRSAETAIRALAASSGGFDFHVESRRLVGVDARCLTVTAKTAGQAAQVLCLSPAGVTLLAQGTAQPVTAVTYRGGASASEFRLPAAPSS
jgi:hypothetical protein